MSLTASQQPRYDVARYFALAEEGLLCPDERTELLEGIIVAMAPQSPLHASAVYCAQCALSEAFPAGTVIRVQMPFVAGAASVPEPDLAVVPGHRRTYIDRHPSSALLIVEVAVATVAQDRLTKAAIYAAAGVPNYWIVHAGEEWIEVYRQPDRQAAAYLRIDTFESEAMLDVDEASGVRVACRQLLPRLAS